MYMFVICVASGRDLNGAAAFGRRPHLHMATDATAPRKVHCKYTVDVLQESENVSSDFWP